MQMDSTEIMYLLNEFQKKQENIYNNYIAIEEKNRFKNINSLTERVRKNKIVNFEETTSILRNKFFLKQSEKEELDIIEELVEPLSGKQR